MNSITGYYLQIKLSVLFSNLKKASAHELKTLSGNLSNIFLLQLPLFFSLSTLKMNDGRARDCGLSYSSMKFATNPDIQYTALDKINTSSDSMYSSLVEAAVGTRGPEQSPPEEETSTASYDYIDDAGNCKKNGDFHNLDSGDGKITKNTAKSPPGEYTVSASYDNVNSTGNSKKEGDSHCLDSRDSKKTQVQLLSEKCTRASSQDYINSAQNRKKEGYYNYLPTGYDKNSGNPVLQLQEMEVSPRNREIESPERLINPPTYNNIKTLKTKNKKNNQSTVKYRVNLICFTITLLVVIILFLLAGTGLIIAFLEILKLRSKLTQLQSTVEQSNNNHSRNTFLVDFSREAGHTFTSCAAIFQLSPSTPSGYYNIRSSNGSAITAYCDMTRSCGGITGGWMRVYNLDMKNNTNQCPDGLEELSTRQRTCRSKNTNSANCSSDKLEVNGVGYSKVCGRIRAYQLGSPDAFGNNNRSSNSGRETNNPNIDTYYVDGVSLTHGDSPRKHIWTFAGALNEETTNPSVICPCINTAVSSTDPLIPSFVGNNYFCDTAATSNRTTFFLDDDPLWDGKGCGPRNICCSFNNPPWFYKELPQSTTDDIEMRVCRDQVRSNEDIAIEAVEIHVQ